MEGVIQNLERCLKDQMPHIQFEVYEHPAEFSVVVLAARRIGKEIIRIKKIIPHTTFVRPEDVASIAKMVRRELIFAIAEHIVQTPPDNFHTVMVMGANFTNDGAEISLVRQWPESEDVPPPEYRKKPFVAPVEEVNPEFASW